MSDETVPALDLSAVPILGPDVSVSVDVQFSCGRCLMRDASGNTCNHVSIRRDREEADRKLSKDFSTPDWCPEQSGALYRAAVSLNEAILAMVAESPPPQTP